MYIICVLGVSVCVCKLSVRSRVSVCGSFVCSWVYRFVLG